MSNYYRRLPHIHPDDAEIFLTWKLWGANPPRRGSVPAESAGRTFADRDRELDTARHGPTWLNDARIAQHVAATILEGARQHCFYQLFAWVVMPNHVHVLLRPRVPMPQITRWLKGSTPRYANAVLDRTGHPFWQDESFDHWIRNQSEFEKVKQYIEHNPVTAGFVSSPGQWPWSSASDTTAGGTASPTI